MKCLFKLTAIRTSEPIIGHVFDVSDLFISHELREQFQWIADVIDVESVEY